MVAILNKLCGFSGAHGSGKSTLLKMMKAMQGQHVHVHEGSVSRKQQDKRKIVVADIAKSFELIKEFQDGVLDDIIDRDLKILSGSLTGVHLVDRSPADVITYSWLWLSEFLINNQGEADKCFDWYTKIYNKCYQHLRANYETVFFINIPSELSFVEEENRASKETVYKFQNFMYLFLNSENSHIRLPIQHISINHPLADRVDAITSHLSSMIEEDKKVQDIISIVYKQPVWRDLLDKDSLNLYEKYVQLGYLNVTQITDRDMYSLTQKSFKLWKKMKEAYGY